MNIVNVNHSINLLKLFLKIFQIYVVRRGLKKQIVTVPYDWHSGNEGEDGEDIGGDGVKQVVSVPLGDLCSLI